MKELKKLNKNNELNIYTFNQNMAHQLRNKIDVMFMRFKWLIIVLFITASVACGPMGAIDDSDVAEASLTGNTEPEAIDLDGDAIELDETYSVEVGDVSLGGSVTSDQESSGETDLENPDTSTVGIMPTIAKEDEECSTEGSTELSVRSLDTGAAEATAYLAAAPSSYARSRRFFTSTDFIASLKITNATQFELLQDDEVEASVDALVCKLDEDGDLTWQPLSTQEIAKNYRVAFGFVDEDNRFSDKNLVLKNIASSGSVYVPKEDLALQDGEQVYVALVNKKTRVIQNSGAVVISNSKSKMVMTFPPNLSNYFGSK